MFLALTSMQCYNHSKLRIFCDSFKVLQLNLLVIPQVVWSGGLAVVVVVVVVGGCVVDPPPPPPPPPPEEEDGQQTVKSKPSNPHGA